jgi:hypothetical protein
MVSCADVVTATKRESFSLKLKEHGAKRAPVVIFKCSIHIHNYYLKK